MSHCSRRFGMVWVVIFVTMFVAIMNIGNNEPAITKASEANETVNIITQEQIVTQIITQQCQAEPPQIQITEIADEELIEEVEVTRDNNLYYIIDSGYRFDISEEWQDYLWSKCVEHEVTEYYDLLFAQIYHESGWNPDAVSSTGDYGLMQINECNHKWLGDVLDITDFLDPYQSIDAGVYLMSKFLKKYNDVQKALVCYNMGEGKVIDGITSSDYSRCVINDMDKLFILEEEEVE